MNIRQKLLGGMRVLKNKRGDVPITVLVIGVFSVCALALFTFFLYDYNVGNSFVGIKAMQEELAGIDEYMFYKNSGMSQADLDSIFNVVEIDGVRYIQVEKRASGGVLSISDDGEKLLFLVRYPVP